MDFKYQTQSLIMRVCTRRDARMVHRFYVNNLRDFMHYEPLDVKAASTLVYYEKLLEIEYDLMLQKKLFRFFLFEKSNPFSVIGTISFRNIELAAHLKNCQIGYKIDQSRRRRGYATEAIALGCRLMFEDLKLHRVEALILPENIPSCRLVESLGFEREGLLRKKVFLNKEWRDHYLYAMLADR